MLTVMQMLTVKYLIIDADNKQRPYDDYVRYYYTTGSTCTVVDYGTVSLRYTEMKLQTNFDPTRWHAVPAKSSFIYYSNHTTVSDINFIISYLK